MKIKSSSWHYKLYCNFFSRTPKDLCSYFWKIIFCLILSIAIGLVSIIVILLYPAIFLLGLMFGYVRRFSFKNPGFSYKPFRLGKFCFYPATLLSPLVLFFIKIATPETIVVNYTIASVSFLAINIISYLIAYDYLYSHDSAWGKEPENSKESDGLFMAYFKAKKRKVCPLIEIVEDENNENQ